MPTSLRGAPCLQEVASSPMLIDAVQALLQNSAAYSSLVDHPEMAPYIRGLRRLVGALLCLCYIAPGDPLISWLDDG